jgi:hypothetical protein
MAFAAEDVINPALKLLGVITQGETPSASESADALDALNAMLDNWSTERLNIFYIYNFTGAISAGTNNYTIATGGTWNTPRPIRIESANILLSGLTHPLEIISAADWAAIKEKGALANVPLKLYYNQASPTGVVYLWPTPNTTPSIDLWLYTALPQFADLVTSYDLGSGYLRPMIYNLAVEIAAQFGSVLKPEVVQIAAESKAAMRMLNAAEPGAPPPTGQISAITPQAPGA